MPRRWLLSLHSRVTLPLDPSIKQLSENFAKRFYGFPGVALEWRARRRGIAADGGTDAAFQANARGRSAHSFTPSSPAITGGG